ncbi:uncharacterized protein LOC127736406 isoform X2 [Mytilus californianus]|uniref:uncharacterized protein LOC127736406 isoform X2 n=1 Tax=Mytilus californianus TaxID=6549 RepID=UPI002247A77E|nr:uncharacterized protein LOC127736406 isoform X2 [Mytilus californianus]
MSKFQDRFCFGIRRESSFGGIQMQRDKTDRIPISLHREKTLNPDRSVYSIHREKSVRGDKLYLNFPRERAFQATQQRKTVRLFEKLSGWNTPDIGEGVVEWMKIQLLIQGKKDRKLRITTEDFVFRHIPRHRCPAHHDAETFEKNSLHSNFFATEKKETEQKPVKKRNPSAVKSANSSSVSDYDHKRRLLRSRSKDDMGIISKSQSIPEDFVKLRPTKRCRSVSTDDDSAWTNPGSTSKLKRLLKCAKLYQSIENGVYDEEDEGYGSKSSSADEKLSRDRQFTCRNKETDLSGWEMPYLDLDSDFRSFNSARKPAKFSYTHQSTLKSQLYGDSEDEGVKDLDTDRTDISSGLIKYYRTGYQDGTPDYITKLLERTYSHSHRDISDMVKIRELRSTRLTVKTISIQDAKEGKNPPEQNKTATNNQKEFYDQQKTLVRSNSSLQTDRTQYPLYCTSPELKFNTSSQRPVSKKNVRSIREEHSQRLAQSELLNKTRFPYLDFYRAHTSVNLPLGELLPAVDRSLKNKSGKTKTYVYENVPNITPVRESPHGVDRESTNINSEQTPQTLGGPPFKEQSKTPEALKRLPSYMLDNYQSSGQWLRNQSIKATEGSHSGLTSLEMSVSGIDVEIKREPDKKKPLGKVRLSGNPDKDAKKKLREAFSRFYNTRSSMKNRDWASDYKHIWNA